MEMNGDPLDACSIACYVAMQSCQVPKITLYPGESGRMEDFEIRFYGQRTDP
jgi:exosome complex RNA-binding protein Rrp42 (RNase PH superfamily)